MVNSNYIQYSVDIYNDVNTTYYSVYLKKKSDQFIIRWYTVHMQSGQKKNGLFILQKKFCKNNSGGRFFFIYK